MKNIRTHSRAPFRRVALCALFTLAGFGSGGVPAPVVALHADTGVPLENDYTFIDIENWAGANWQAAGWMAIPIKKARLERSVVQLGFDFASPYGTGEGPSFLLRVRLDDRFVFLTNSAKVAANKPDTILMQKKGRVFEGVLPRGGLLTDATVDYGKETVHYTEGDLNAGNANDPRFTSLRFITVRDGAGVGGVQGGGGAGWEAVSFGIPEYYAGSNWSVAVWAGAKGKRFGEGAVVRIGYDLRSIYRDRDKAVPKQNFLCRLVFKSGGAVFLTNDAGVARRKGDVVIMEQKEDCFEARISGRGELSEVAVDFGESSLAYGRGTWNLNEKNAADVRFNSLQILPVTKTLDKSPPPPVPAAPQPVAQGQEWTPKGEYGTPAYYGGPNWVVAVFNGAAGLKLKKDTALRLHFDSASCFNTDEKVSFLLRVVFKDGKTVYASNSEKIVSVASGDAAARLALNKAGGFFEGSLAGLGEGGTVREIAVDFGESTSHLSTPLNADNNNNPRFSKLIVLEKK
jgi:hypothetical protein